jgi:2'-5' RNA ligase
MSLYEAEFEAAWKRFNSLLRTGDHWRALFDWTEERQVLAFLVPVHSLFPHLATATAQLREDLQGLRGVEVVPPEFLHVSVQLAGTLGAADTTWSEVERLSLQAGDVIRVAPPFDMKFGPVNAFPEAAIIEVHDGGAIRELRHRLRQVWPRVLRNGAERLVEGEEDHFLPHMSIAYFDGTANASEVGLVLDRYRNESFGTVTVDKLELVMTPILNEQHFPSLETITRWELTGQSRPVRSLADIKALRAERKMQNA